MEIKATSVTWSSILYTSHLRTHMDKQIALLGFDRLEEGDMQNMNSSDKVDDDACHEE